MMKKLLAIICLIPALSGAVTNTMTGTNIVPSGSTFTSASGSTSTFSGAVSGTPTGGTWNLSNVGLTLPNGVTIGSHTLTLGGNTTVSGSSAFTMTTTGTTNATFPAGTKTLLATDGSGSALTGIDATQISFTQAGTGAVPTTLAASRLLGYITPEDYGCAGNGTTDDTTNFQKMLNVRAPVWIPANTYKITAALTEKFSGRIVKGADSRHSIIKQVTAGEHGVVWVADSASDPNFGAGIYATSWRDLTVNGPGTFDNSTGLFTGSTGDGFHLQNGGSTYYGDEHYFCNLHISGFLRQFVITGIGNTVLVNCGLEYGGTGLYIGGSGTNSIRTVGLITSNLAVFNIDVRGGSNISLGVADTNANANGSCTQINSVASSIDIYGGNFEQCSAGGNVVNISGGGFCTMWGSTLARGSGADNTAIINGGALVLNACKIGGYTTKYSGGGTVSEIGSQSISLGAPPAGGGFLMRGSGGGGNVNLGIDWERYIQGDYAIIGASNKNYYYLDATGNKTTIGHNAASQPSGTATLNVEGSINVSGAVNLGTTHQGDILYDNGTNIVRLTPGTSGNFLKTQGASANPVWASASPGTTPLIVASADATAQSATNASVVTYATPNDSTVHSFRAGAYAAITAISAGTLTVQVSFTDENSAAQTISYFPMGLTSAGLTTTGFTPFESCNLRCAPNTAITIKTTFTGVSVAYDIGGTIESLY